MFIFKIVTNNIDPVYLCITVLKKYGNKKILNPALITLV